MQIILRILLLALIAFPLAAAGDETVTIGSEKLTIPIPAGFVRFDGTSPQFDEAMQKMVPPTNRMLLMLSTAEAQSKIKAGLPFDLNRYYVLQTFRQTEHTKVSFTDFESLRDGMKKQISAGTALSEAQEHTQNALNKAQLKDLKIGEMKALGVFDETAQSLDFGLIAQTQSGTAAPEPVITAASVALVKGKVTYFYVYSNYHGDTDVAWARAAVKAWRESTLAANADGLLGGNDSLPGSNADSTGSKVLKGAIVGGVVGLLVALVRKKKTVPPPPPV